MTDMTPPPFVPKLRFPEFRRDGAWEAKTLDDCCERITETVGDTELIPVSISSGKGFIPQTEKFGRDISGEQYSKYIWIRRGDFAYNRGNSKRFPQGCIYPLVEFDEAAASNAFYCFRLNPECEPAFFSGLFEKNAHGRQLSKFITSSARNTGLLNIRADDFFGITIPIPKSSGEQQKIAACLTSLEDLIAAEGRKLDALRRHKQGLMRQLFPQPGETAPRLRFPAFEDRPQWSVRPLREIADYENGKAYEQHVVDDGQYVIVNSRFISTDGRVRKYTNERFCIADTGDVLLVLSDLPAAKALARCFLVDRSDTYAVNQRVARLRPHSIIGEFLLFAIEKHSYLMAFSDGINQTHLSKAAVEECPISMPEDSEEQRLVADCITSVDRLYVAHRRQLESLECHKRGLLQQLFPAPEEESR